ncbi:MAG TPA: hypothetical protein VIK97_11740 [Casimicrobiaceae bacterium]
MSNLSQRKAAPVPARVSQSTDLKRRRFLLALGASGAGAAAVAAQALAAPVVPAAVSADADASQGYRETDHIRDYYATTRL